MMSVVKKTITIASVFLLLVVLSGMMHTNAVFSASNSGKSNISPDVKNIPADSQNKNIPDYSGIYKSSDPDACRIVITIKKNNKGYSYTINAAGVRSSGWLTVEIDGDQTYMMFNGTLRSGDKTPVEASYSEKKITIQNYGNAINQYICFKKCDVKYIELVKAD